MAVRQLAVALTLTLALALVAPATAAWPGGGAVAEAGGKKASKSKKVRKAKRAKRRGKRVRKTKVCTRRNGKRRCRWITEFRGNSVKAAKLRSEPLPRPSGEIALLSVNQREAIEVNIYGDDGELDEEVLASLDVLFRCKRSDRVRAIDPRLYEILSHVYEHFGRMRVELVSGFRFKERQSSRHFHGAAMDIRIPGISSSELADYVETLDTGGMGIGRYPSSGFVHVDMRAPGTGSYRWVDYSSSESRQKKRSRPKRPGKPSQRKQRPTS